MKKTFIYILKVVICIGLATAIFPIAKKLIDVFITSENDRTIEIIYLTTFVLIYSTFKELTKPIVKKLVTKQKQD